MDINLAPIATTKRPALGRLFQLYLHDMSAQTGWPINDDGTFHYPNDLLSPYWTDPDHYPYFIKAGDEIAGFSLIRRAPDDATRWDIGQFFTLQKFRRQGIGQQAFQASITHHPGPTQIRVLPANKPAYHFWKNCVSSFTYKETEQDYQGQTMTFIKFQT